MALNEGEIAIVKGMLHRLFTKVGSRGAAWGSQRDRMGAAIYFPLFPVLIAGKHYSIFYLSADLQAPKMFKARKPLSLTARRAGWRGSSRI